MVYRRASMTAAALALGLALVACGDSDDDSVESATEDYCQAVADVVDQAVTVQQLNADSTVDDAQSAVDDLESAVDAAEDAAEELGQAEVDALQDAYSDLQSSIDDISDSDTIAEALPQVSEARDAFVAQWEEIRSANCVEAAASTTTGSSETTVAEETTTSGG